MAQGGGEGPVSLLNIQFDPIFRYLYPLALWTRVKHLINSIMSIPCIHTNLLRPRQSGYA